MRILLCLLLLSVASVQAGNRYSNAFAVKIVQSGAARPSALQLGAVNRLSASVASQIGWTGFYAIYPFIGPSATANNVNLIAPGTFTCTQNGTVTNNANGITGDGTTGYLDTGFNPVAYSASLSSFSLSTYSRGPSPAGGTSRLDIGTQDSTTNIARMGWMDGGTIEGARIGGSSTDSPPNAPTSNTVHVGFASGILNGSRVLSYYLNGAALSGTATMGGSFSNRNFFILCVNVNGTATAFSQKNLAFVAIGTGRSAAQEAKFYQIVEAYQVALRRGGF